MQMLALTGNDAKAVTAGRWEPKRLRLSLFSIAARLTTTARTTALHLSAHAPWTQLATGALDRLATLTTATTASG
jgi:hypothetical protein